MPTSLNVWPEPWRREDDSLVISTTLEWADGAREELWYRVPEEWERATTQQLDPFAVALVMLAMHRRADVKFRGRVSPSLLANLEEYQAIWQFWKPDAYIVVDLAAEEEAEAEAAPQGGAIVSFSGGADACYTVYRHVQGLAGRRNVAVRAGLLVEGFDIPLGDPTFATAAAGGKRLLDSVGVPLVTAATNWRELENRHRLDWTDSFGSAIVSCISLFSRGFAAGMLASGDRYYNVRPHGSTPLTDPLLGSGAFCVRNDGAAASRVEKVSLISQWPQAVQDLRVCWEGEHKGRNCSRCEKCVRTILNFRAIGQALPPCFEHDATLEQIRTIPIEYVTQLDELQSIVAHAEGGGLGEEAWVRALRERVAGYRRNPSGQSVAARIRERLAVRTRLRKLLQ
jgi:hypothetical protein